MARNDSKREKLACHVLFTLGYFPISWIVIKTHAVRECYHASYVRGVASQVSRWSSSNVQDSPNDGSNITLLKISKIGR